VAQARSVFDERQRAGELTKYWVNHCTDVELLVSLLGSAMSDRWRKRERELLKCRLCCVLLVSQDGIKLLIVANNDKQDRRRHCSRSSIVPFRKPTAEPPKANKDSVHIENSHGTLGATRRADVF